jgi:hypothetical protein
VVFSLILFTFFQSFTEAVVDIVKREGLLGLYSGLESSLLGIAVTNGLVRFKHAFSKADCLLLIQSLLLLLREIKSGHLVFPQRQQGIEHTRVDVDRHDSR